MTVIRRTKFSDGYLLEKVRAISESARDRADACRHALNLVHDTFPHYTWTGLYLKRPRSLFLAFHRGADAIPPEPSEPLEGLLGWAVRSRRPQILPDAGGSRYEHIEIPIKSEIILPVFLQGRVVAVLDICSSKPKGFDRLDQDLLEAVCKTIAPLVPALEEKPAGTDALEQRRQRRGYG